MSPAPCESCCSPPCSTPPAAHPAAPLVYTPYLPVAPAREGARPRRRCAAVFASEDEDAVVGRMQRHAEATARRRMRCQGPLLHLAPHKVGEAHDVQVVEPSGAPRGVVEASEQHEVVPPDAHAVPTPSAGSLALQGQLLPRMALELQSPEVPVVVELGAGSELSAEDVHEVAVDHSLVTASGQRRVGRLHLGPQHVFVPSKAHDVQVVEGFGVDAIEEISAEQHCLVAAERREAEVAPGTWRIALEDGDGRLRRFSLLKLPQNGVEVVIAGLLGEFLPLLRALLLLLGRLALLALLARVLVPLLLAHDAWRRRGMQRGASYSTAKRSGVQRNGCLSRAPKSACWCMIWRL
eukprot:scaffold878_cov271-Pinguiococcus_pyrenoidosus.AAC.11